MREGPRSSRERGGTGIVRSSAMVGGHHENHQHDGFCQDPRNRRIHQTCSVEELAKNLHLDKV